MASTDPTMRVTQGLTYRRLVTWDRPGVPSDYTAHLVVRRRYDAATTLIDVSSPVSLVMGGVAGAITVNIKLTPVQTALLPIGTDYKATLVLTTAADVTENWGVQWDVNVRASTLAVV